MAEGVAIRIIRLPCGWLTDIIMFIFSTVVNFLLHKLSILCWPRWL